jgi:hypothetical protein
MPAPLSFAGARCLGRATNTVNAANALPLSQGMRFDI